MIMAIVLFLVLGIVMGYIIKEVTWSIGGKTASNISIVLGLFAGCFWVMGSMYFGVNILILIAPYTLGIFIPIILFKISEWRCERAS